MIKMARTYQEDKDAMGSTPLDDSTFEAEFYRRVELIKERAKDAGTNITQLCRMAGVSRTTPERWEKRVPKSIGILDLMFEALKEVESDRQAQQEAFAQLPPRERDRLKAQEEERKREAERQRRERRNESRRQSRLRQKDASSESEEE
ncbi:hypothetical protein Q6670_004085 [Salmonella enterica]|nr:hypothetical protein [Salmonella enterica]